MSVHLLSFVAATSKEHASWNSRLSSPLHWGAMLTPPLPVAAVHHAETNHGHKSQSQCETRERTHTHTTPISDINANKLKAHWESDRP